MVIVLGGVQGEMLGVARKGQFSVQPFIKRLDGAAFFPHGAHLIFPVTGSLAPLLMLSVLPE